MGLEEKGKCYQILKNLFVLEQNYAAKLEN